MSEKSEAIKALEESGLSFFSKQSTSHNINTINFLNPITMAGQVKYYKDTGEGLWDLYQDSKQDPTTSHGTKVEDNWYEISQYLNKNFRQTGAYTGQQVDAVRHYMGIKMMSQKYGPEAAHYGGFAHEIEKFKYDYNELKNSEGEYIKYQDVMGEFDIHTGILSEEGWDYVNNPNFPESQRIDIRNNYAAYIDFKEGQGPQR